jgi:hypothetical protein
MHMRIISSSESNNKVIESLELIMTSYKDTVPELSVTSSMQRETHKNREY